TRRHDHVRPSFRGHLNSLDTDAHFLFRFVEEHQPATAAAERAVPAALHFHTFHTRDRVEHIAGIVVNLVMPSQIAGIVIRVDHSVLYWLELDPAGSYVARDELTDVLDRRYISIVVFQRVESVRIGGDDALDSGGPDGLRVVVPQRDEQGLFPEAPNFVATVLLDSAQNSEVRAAMIENLRCGPRNRLHAVVVRRDAVD